MVLRQILSTMIMAVPVRYFGSPADLEPNFEHASKQSLKNLDVCYDKI
jgi:hypothetical protein